MKISGLFSKEVTFVDPVAGLKGSKFETNNWIISDFIIRKLVPIVGVQPFPLNELMLMTSAVCKFRPEYIFEWGTHIGKSARVFYEICTAFKIDAKIHSVDLPDDQFHVEHPGKSRATLVKDISAVSLHQGDGVETALKIYSELGKEVRTLFFIDGDHSYETVKRELNAITNAVKFPVMLLHDTFYQSSESGYNIGPNEAIKNHVDKNIFEIIETGLGLPGMTLLYPKK